MRRQTRRASRGIAMIAVLIALLLLSILASALFLQARDSGSVNNILVAQGIANINADMGMQEAVRRIRSSQIDPAQVPVCTSAQVDTSSCTWPVGSGATVGPISGPNNDPLNGGGLLYRFDVYQRPGFVLGTDPGQPKNRYVIRATGYYGRTLDAINLVTSVVEAEVDMGRESKQSGICTGGYGDCGT
ncbi:MAG: hypothetical protein JNJ54_27915 [Myxococcaceae bacterium]|nr:hypothetical protein [Myxococcaceae bacterium]